ncbi:hypothetical protein [Novosphingobium sp. BL-52-GroH]|uniref:hypothetical protein n=1 Tax=Novosphingobium sp. BL-52-GroH TaxID=3349877 RepID=UPI00384F2A07
MSDAEKVLAFARNLGSTTPIVLRWEGAGDCLHVFDVLKPLSEAHYNGSKTAIKFRADVNLYESKGSKVAQSARALLDEIWAYGPAGQSINLYYDVNLTRESKAITQPPAHLMFVRNIMPTDASKTSSEIDGDVLRTLHRSGVTFVPSNK